MHLAKKKEIKGKKKETTSEVGPSGELRPPWRESKGGEWERGGRG